MAPKIVGQGTTVMGQLVDLERELFLAGMLSQRRSRHLQIARVSLELCLDFVTDIARLRADAEDALATDTGIARTLEAKLLDQ